MKKYKHKNICSCSDIPFTIIYESEEKQDEFYCPFCGSNLDFNDEKISDDVDNPYYD